VAYRCDLHLNGGHRRLIIARGREETFENLALRLAGYVLFWPLDPQVEISPKHPAVAQVEYKPDFLALNAGGELVLWGECGNVSLRKLDKLTRRFPGARIVALKASPAEGRQLRDNLAEEAGRHHRIEILSFQPGDFAPWRDALAETTQIFGESDERSLNLVINDVPLACTLLSA
jgi:hypothetical protein